MHLRASSVLLCLFVSAAVGFGADAVVFGPETFTRAAGPPRTDTRTIRVDDPSGKYVLRVANQGVTSAQIELNAGPVLRPGDFTAGQNRNDQPVDIERAVELRAGVNTLTVRINGRPGTSLTVSLVNIGGAPPDTTPPTITAAVDQAPNANGWNNAPVTVSFTCADPGGSGIATCTAPVTVSDDVANHVVTGTATDNAGNSASTSVTLNIDRTSPVIGVVLSPEPNAAGIFATPVEAHFTCTDTLSGVAACSPDQLLQTEGANRQVTGSVTDRAGNTASATSAPFTIDLTRPTITVNLDPAPNTAGWNNSPVTATFSCADAITTVVECPPPQTLSSEGARQGVTGMATDAAGHTAEATAVVSLDRTPPSLTLTSPPNGSILFTPDVTIAGTVTDDLSGVAGVDCRTEATTVHAGALPCDVTLARGPNALTVIAADTAGNTTEVPLGLNYNRVPILTITDPPTLSFVNTPVITVNGTVDDPTAVVTINSISAPLSGGTFTSAVPLAEGPNIITASASNDDGAVGTASIEVTLDTTPPRVTITSPPDRFLTTGDHVSVAGIINDIVVGTVNETEATVKVNGRDAQVANRTFLATDVPLTLGDNVIDVLGRDRVGNSANVQLTVTRAPATAAEIRLVSGNNQSAPIAAALPQPLVVALVDALGAPVADQNVIFKVVQNDGLIQPGAGGAAPAATVIVRTDASGRASVLWTLGNRAGAGGNTVEAYSVQFAGTAIFSASGTQGAPGKIVVDTGNDQIGGVGQALPKPLIAVVVDGGNNRLADVDVTFTIRRGGGHFSGSGETVTVRSDSDGRVAATLVLGPDEGNANNLVEATFVSNTGGPATFTASGRMPGDPVQTTISGVVLDNSNIPIPGVTVRAVLTSELRVSLASVASAFAVETDAEGQFVLPQAPVGLVKLMVDGTTASLPGKYPALEYDLVTVAGRNNDVGQPIFMLPLAEDDAHQMCVGPDKPGGTLTDVPDAPGFSLSFVYGQVTFPGGSKTGCVSVTVVHGDKVPMTPGFGQQPRFIVTIQPAGAVFNPPAAITLPNVDGLKPRQVTEMYSFDHDIGSFVAIGTGVVSDDGLVISSSPGVGVLKAGWHCGGDPSSSGMTGSISVTASAAVAETTAGSAVDITANGNPPQDGKYITWEVFDDPADPDDDPSVAAFTSTPTCDNQPTCVAPLQGNKIGIASVRVTFLCTTTGVTAVSNIVKVKFTLGLKVKEVTFLDDIDIYEDQVGSAPKIMDPVWKDTNAPADNKPAAYVRSRTMKVTVKFEVNPVPMAPVSGVTIEGEIPGLGKFVKTGVTIPAAAEVIVSDITADTALPATTKFYDPMTINWRHMADGKSCPDCEADGSSANKVYVTLATPTQPQVYRTTLHFAVSNDGATTQGEAVSKTWDLIKGPANIKTWDGRLLYYYRPGVGFDMCATNELGLLTRANGSGQCGSFTRLMMAALATNGVPSTFAVIEPTTAATKMVINNWDYVGQAFPGAPQYKWRLILNVGDYMVPPKPGNIYGDLHSQTTLVGQNTAPPSEKVFDLHFVVHVSPGITGMNPYFDPSYGVQYSSAADLEMKAIKGYADSFLGDAPGVYRFRERGGAVGITITP